MTQSRRAQHKTETQLQLLLTGGQQHKSIPVVWFRYAEFSMADVYTRLYTSAVVPQNGMACLQPTGNTTYVELVAVWSGMQTQNGD